MLKLGKAQKQEHSRGKVGDWIEGGKGIGGGVFPGKSQGTGTYRERRRERRQSTRQGHPGRGEREEGKSWSEW